MKIKCNEKQLRLMAEAIEFYSRYLAGQLTDFPLLFKGICGRKTKEQEVMILYGLHLQLSNEGYGIMIQTKVQELAEKIYQR